MADDPAPAAAAARPATLLVVAATLAVEAAGLVVVAALTVRALVTGTATSGGLSAGVVVVALGVGALLGAAARALLAGRRWGRAPALTWQVLQLTVAVPALLSSVQAVPLVLLVASLVVGVGLFLPDVVRFTAGRATGPSTL